MFLISLFLTNSRTILEQAHSKIAPLTLLDLDYLFRFYFLILGLLFVAFVAHWTLVCLSAIWAHYLSTWLASFYRFRLRRRATVDIVG